jgi:hypothetical protein
MCVGLMFFIHNCGFGAVAQDLLFEICMLVMGYGFFCFFFVY